MKSACFVAMCLSEDYQVPGHRNEKSRLVGGFESLVVWLRSYKPLQCMYLPWCSVPLAQHTGLNFYEPRCPRDGAWIDWRLIVVD